jgi:hypothetical protein
MLGLVGEFDGEGNQCVYQQLGKDRRHPQGITRRSDGRLEMFNSGHLLLESEHF